MINSSTINIRQATLEDVAKILPLFVQFFEEDGFDIAFEDLPTVIASMLNDPRSAIFVVWYGVDAIGVATVTTTSQGLEFNRHAELEDLYVIPEARQAGIGRVLIYQVKQWCRQMGSDAQASRNLITYYQKHDPVEQNYPLFHTARRTLRGFEAMNYRRVSCAPSCFKIYSPPLSLEQ